VALGDIEAWERHDDTTSAMMQFAAERRKRGQR
jgi:hypothetical protein